MALAAWFADTNLNGYQQQLFILSAIWAIVAVALALTSGFTGVFSLGQIGFLAIGAYVSAILSMPPMVKQPMLLPGLPSWLATFDSTGWHPQVALLFASIIARSRRRARRPPRRRAADAPLRPLRGGGDDGIPDHRQRGGGQLGRGHPRCAWSESDSDLDELPGSSYIWAAIAVYVALRLRNSPYGRAMIASRENLIAARGIGVNVLNTRLRAFVVSAFLTGVAGSLLAHQIGTVAPSAFYFSTTFNIIIMVVLGGMGSISGAVIGAIIMTVTPELLRPLERGFELGPFTVGTAYGLSNIILAVAFIAIMIVRPQGLFGERELGLALLGRRTPQQEWGGEDVAITPELAPEVDAPIPDPRA